MESCNESLILPDYEKSKTFNVFYMVMAGKIKLLEEAKRHCEYLIVGLQIDPTIDRLEINKLTRNMVERYIQMKSSLMKSSLMQEN